MRHFNEAAMHFSLSGAGPLILSQFVHDAPKLTRDIPGLHPALASMCRLLLSTAIVLVLGTSLGAGAVRAQTSVLDRPANISLLARALSPSESQPHLIDDAVRLRLFRAVEMEASLMQPTNRRAWWILPSAGAGAGAVGLSYHVYRECQSSDCILNPLAVPVYGAVLGGLVGLGLEGLLRLVGV